MTKEALTLALEALEKERPYLGAMPVLTSKAITAIKEALSELEQDDEVLGFNGWGFPIEKPSQPEQEPVKYEFQVPDGTWHPFLDKTHYENTVEDGSWPIRALYTTPPQRKPLTDEQICEIEKDHLVNFRIPLGGQYDFVRAIEAAHGIKE